MQRNDENLNEREAKLWKPCPKGAEGVTERWSRKLINDINHCILEKKRDMQMLINVCNDYMGMQTIATRTPIALSASKVQYI